jgi:hypothetical protein
MHAGARQPGSGAGAALSARPLPCGPSGGPSPRGRGPRPERAGRGRAVTRIPVARPFPRRRRKCLPGEGDLLAYAFPGRNRRRKRPFERRAVSFVRTVGPVPLVFGFKHVAGKLQAGPAAVPTGQAISRMFLKGWCGLIRAGNAASEVVPSGCVTVQATPIISRTGWCTQKPMRFLRKEVRASPSIRQVIRPSGEPAST